MILSKLDKQTNSTSFCIQNLLVPEVYPHPVGQIELLETHISCIVLTGEFAYKIKKPVDLGFVDYTTLERRKRFCELEVKLNRRFAPDIYLGVVPIFKTATGFRIGDSCLENMPKRMVGSSVFEYAVKMKQFPQDAIVASRLADPSLSNDSVEAFGRYVARFHDSIEIVDADLPFVQPAQITHDASDNFEFLLDSLAGDRRFRQLEKIEYWTNEQATRLEPKFGERLRSGKVRRCHGDLHLKNIIQVDGRLLAFDGIEFNEAFQCVDVLNEIAFPVVDFWARDRADLAWRLLNSYLEQTGEYADLDVLRFYLVYRAMVRAKVAWLNPGNHTEARRTEYATSDNPDDPFAGPWDKYLRAAAYFAFEMQPSLSITHGFSGSGKSTVAMNMIAVEGGIRIRSDVERSRLMSSSIGEAKYSKAMSQRVYGHLLGLAKSSVQSGFPIIVDATFLQQKRRMPFQQLAEQLDVEYRIIDCQAPFNELCRRLRLRENDPSEADVNVLQAQMKNHDPIGDNELPFVKSYESHQ